MSSTTSTANRENMLIRHLSKPLAALPLSVFFLASFSQSALNAQVYTISTFAGNNTAGFSGDGSAATGAEISSPFGLAVDSAGVVYIADQFNHRIRKVTKDGNISTVAGNGTSGYTGDGSAATSAELSNPTAVAFDKAGNMYISDTGNSVVRKVTTSGTISTVAGNFTLGAGFGGDGAAATAAQLNHPSQIAVDSAGNLFIADSGNEVVRKVTTDGNINNFAGNAANTLGFSGDGGAATNARINNPTGVAVDAAGNVYISDTNNNRIRKVTTDGIITTIAGNIGGFAGDGGPASKARLTSPKGLTLDSAGNLYISDAFNGRVRVISAVSGNISTIAGNGSTGYGGDGGPALSASFYFPTGVAIDGAGVIYVSDNQNNVIRALAPMAQVPVIYSNGVVSATAFSGATSAAPGSFIEIYGTALANVTTDWSSSFSGINAPTKLGGTSVQIGGQAAYVAFVSPNQVNVQVPSNVTPGSQPLTVSTAMGTGASYSLTIAATQPGLLAPSSFVINGFSYAAAFLPDGTFVLPSAGLPGVTSRPAKPGETITFYGIGFGPVTPDIPAGQMVQGTNTLLSPATFTFGGVAAISSYSGLAPGLVGVYQFNVLVPAIPNSDAYPLHYSLGGVTDSQNLFTAVHN